MLAQWIAIASQESFRKARTEPLITLGSAPLFDPGFRSVILGQLGESRLVAAIDADIAGEQAHAKALDADTRGPLRDIHRRVGTAILFESSGGQTDKVAHLPELRFVLGEPEVDTTSVDNAAFALEDKSYFIRKAGSDGFKISHQPTMKKVVSDRRASLDEETEIKPAMRKLVEDEFRRGASIPVVPFPRDGAEVPDSPRLALVVVDPEAEWTPACAERSAAGRDGGSLRSQIAEWTKQRGKAPRLYPGSLVWCIKKPGRDLREKVELWLAWKRVAREVADGTLGGDFDRTDRAEIQSKVKDAEEAAKDEVWGGYRFAVIYDPSPPAPLPRGEGSPAEGLKTIDLGAGHSSSGETLCGRVIAALKSEALLNESVGAGYIERNWPPALKESGAWPLASLRQSFLNGSLTRLLDPDATLRGKIVEFVERGDFGLASGQKTDLPAASRDAAQAGGTYERVWFEEPVGSDEVAFESGVFLLTKAKAQVLKAGVPAPAPGPEPQPGPPVPLGSEPEPEPGPAPAPGVQMKTIRLVGAVPPELWNRLGTKVLPKLRLGSDLKVGVNFSVTVNREVAGNLTSDLRQILDDLGLTEKVRIEEAAQSGKGDHC
jgi:hypothetical protein